MKIQWPRVRAWGLSEQAIRNIVYNEMHHVLDDIEFRVAQAYEVARREGRDRLTYAEDMAINAHLLTGYTVTANSPGAGQIAWASLHIVYGGNDYAITDGNCATTDYYCWFQKSTATGTPPSMTATMQKATTAAKPTLATGDAIVFLNNAGTPISCLETGTLANVVANNAVDAGALQSQAVTAAKIANGTITSTQISGTANITGGQLSSTAGITGGQLSASAGITGGQLSATAGIVGSQLTNGTIGSTQIGNGAVSGVKLSILEHVIY